MRISTEITSANYTFNATLKTITFTGIVGLSLEAISLITNVITGTVIYQFQKIGKRGTFSGNVLTLEFDTTLMSNSDSLKINATLAPEQVLVPISISRKSQIITTSGDTTILTPTSGKKLRIYGFGYSASGTLGTGNLLVQWKFASGGTYKDAQYLTGNQPFSKTPGNGKFCYDGGVNEPFIVTLSSIADIAVNLDYEEI